MKVNKEWHEKNKMPKNPTLVEKMEWHWEHAKKCGCKPIPKNLLNKLIALSTIQS